MSWTVLWLKYVTYCYRGSVAVIAVASVVHFCCCQAAADISAKLSHADKAYTYATPGVHAVLADSQCSHSLSCTVNCLLCMAAATSLSVACVRRLANMANHIGCMLYGRPAFDGVVAHDIMHQWTAWDCCCAASMATVLCRPEVK